MNFTVRPILRLLIAFTLLAATVPARAVLLNWDSVSGTAADWVDGGTSRSFNVDASNPGNDITITITAVGGAVATTDFPQNTQSGPSVIANNDQHYLQLRTDGFVSSSRSFIVTITFNYTGGVYAMTALSDIDRQTGGGGWVDRISNITGIAAVGGAVVPLTVVDSAANTLSGSGTGVMVDGSAGNITDHSGDVGISSGSTKVTSITFQWSNPGPNFGGQVISLHDVFFTTTPEVGTASGALLVCGLAVGSTVFGRQRHRARFAR